MITILIFVINWYVSNAYDFNCYKIYNFLWGGSCWRSTFFQPRSMCYWSYSKIHYLWNLWEYRKMKACQYRGFLGICRELQLTRSRNMSYSFLIERLHKLFLWTSTVFPKKIHIIYASWLSQITEPFHRSFMASFAYSVSSKKCLLYFRTIYIVSIDSKSPKTHQYQN